jgi:putative CocE/NonD family hydrolase
MPVDDMFGAGDRPPTTYERAPEHAGIVREVDVVVPMRDGVKLVLDVYRPDAPGRFPALLAFGGHPKHIQGPDFAAATPPQPSWSTLWTGHMESGDTQFFVSRGYIHVIGSPRGIGKSESGGSRDWDAYDVIEWIAAQPWCDGKVGMAGIGAFGTEQFAAAKLQPPHLKTIFPFDGRGAYGPHGGFREEYPGGVIHLFRYLIDHFSAVHAHKGQPGELPPAKEALWREAMANADYKMYPHVFNVVAQKGQHMPRYFDLLLDPYDNEKAVEQSERDFAKITIPTYMGAAWYGYTYKTHLNGAQSYFANIAAPKKLVLAGPSHLERPWRSFRNETLRWYDHWLKGIDSGMMDEPPVKYWVMGANEWRSAQDWPLPETRWTKLYLNSWERLSAEPCMPASYDEVQPPDVFAQMPPTQTNRIARLRYMTDPLPDDLLIAGPITLNLFAAIDQDDTNWIVILKDVGPDVSVRTVREGERDIADNLPERELTRGWLKASLRALDPVRSKPWKPWHPLTRASRRPVEPGKIEEYAIEILSTANLFRRGHRICVEITNLDLPTGVAGATNAEYIPYHICSSRTTVHRIYRDLAHPSHLLLPIIPRLRDGAG